MTSETAIEIINAICDKIGIVYDKAIGLVPYIVKYNIACELALIFAAAAMAGVGVFLIRTAKKNAEAYNALNKVNEYSTPREWSDYLGGVFGAAVLCVAGIALLISVGTLITWLIAPEISALKWALILIGGN